MKENGEKADTNILGQMRGLEPGGEMEFPVERLYYIRSCASTINLLRGYKSLRTKADAKSRIVRVIRCA